MVWTPPVLAAGAWAKLKRAREHFDVVRMKVEPVDRGDTYRITLDIDPDTGEYLFRVHDLEPLDPDWGLIIGDCLHNARSALDHLMVSLFALATGQEPADIGNVQFPIDAVLWTPFRPRPLRGGRSFRSPWPALASTGPPVSAFSSPGGMSAGSTLSNAFSTISGFNGITS